MKAYRLRTASIFVILTLFMVAIGYVIGWFFGYGYLGEDVLKASTDHGGRVAPDEENVIFCDMVKNVFLKGLVPGRIQ